MKEALLLIDIQKDFCKGGALAVKDADDVVPVANEWINKFGDGLIIATQDWHPENHGSFAINHPERKEFEFIDLNGLGQVLWPKHCVQHGIGAEFHDSLLPIPNVFCKGEDPAVDSYSGFFDNGRRNKTDLDAFLKQNGVESLVVMGLATDYCVKFTVLDALELGYKVTVILAGCRAVGMGPNDEKQSIDVMKLKGATII